jgi:hypothetical protein
MSEERERELRRAQAHAAIRRHRSTSRLPASAPVSPIPELDDPARLAETIHNNLVWEYDSEGDRIPAR